MKRALFIILGLVLLAAIVAAATTLSQRDQADPVAPSEVESRNDARDSRVDTPGEPDEAPGLRPDPGTYKYVGSGRESVDTLGGSEHVYPKQVPVTVDLHDGCEWTLRIFYVEQHLERRRFCTSSTGVRDVRFSREIEFFRTTENQEFRCDKSALRWQRGARPGTSWTYRCKGDDRTLDYTITYVGPERVVVDGRREQAHHIRAVTKLTGASEGTDRSEYWYAPSGLPLRWSTDLDIDTESLIGRTRFREKTGYALSSMTPA